MHVSTITPLHFQESNKELHALKLSLFYIQLPQNYYYNIECGPVQLIIKLSI